MNCAFITSYERDDETDLDFAQARMYAKNHGRFTTVDPILSSGKTESPQSWNRYLYVMNNPLIFIDPSGLYECKADKTECNKIADGLTKVGDAQKQYKEGSKEYNALQRVLDAYGCDAVVCGDKGKNGVTILVGDSDSAEGETFVEGKTGKKTDFNPSGQNIVVLFDRDLLKKSSERVGATLTHEGTHVADGRAWVESNFSKDKNPTLYTHEKDAYFAESYYYQKTYEVGGGNTYSNNGKNKTYRVWDHSWKKVDEERLNNINVIIKNEYSVTSAQQGRKAFKYPSQIKTFKGWSNISK